ncbi:MAG: S-layer protein [Anaerocolumna sp.]|nr:S-layer protein [Anaerocolumna sp.]
MKIKRFMAVLLCVLIILSCTQIASAEQSTDYNNHWARETIEKWEEKIHISDYPANTFSPNKAISRIEFIVFTNRVFGFVDAVEINFKDVSVTDWYYDEVRKAIKVGYIRGYDDGTMRPNQLITRQEAAVILARLVKAETLKLLESELVFTDSAHIASWCSKEVKAIASKGYMKGYPDGRFGPLDQITRAEAITILDRAEEDYEHYITIEKPGIYTFGQYTGDITILSGGVTLKDTSIQGNITITSTAAMEDIQFQNVIINGVLIISSIDSNIDLLSCNIAEMQVRSSAVINIPVGTEIGNLLLQSNADIKGFGKIKAIRILANGVRIEQRLVLVQFGEGISAVIGYGVDDTDTKGNKDSDNEDRDPKPVAKDIPEQVLNISDTIVITASQLARYANSIIEVVCETDGVVEAVIENKNTLKITGVALGVTTVKTTEKNSRGRVNVEFAVQVVDETLDAHQVEEVKERLELTVQKAHGKNQIPTIELPNTDSLDYCTEIIWSADNENYINIEQERAVIYRRGKDSGGSSGDDHHAAILTTEAIVLLSEGCEDEGSGEDEGCSGDGGKTMIVNLKAVIKKGATQDEKFFKVNIPWGWGKAITIGDKGSEHDHDETEEKSAPIPRNLPELIMEIDQNPALIPSRILAQYGHTIQNVKIENVKFASGDAVSIDLATGDVVKVDFSKGNRLDITPISTGGAKLIITLLNDQGEDSTIDLNVTVEDEGAVTDDMAIEAAKELIYLKLDLKGEGPKQDNRIKLPGTDPYGYGTGITWTTDNEDFITIEGDEAVIYRRGQSGEGGCDDDHEESVAGLSLQSAEDEGGCGEDHEDSEDSEEGGCGEDHEDSEDSEEGGGKKTIVELTATITRGDEEISRSFKVNIPWGWGKAITIGK